MSIAAWIGLCACVLVLVVSVGAKPSDAISAYHAVTFEENDSPSDAVYATQTENAPTPLTSFSNLSPAFLNPGFTFTGWNTMPDGSGTNYSDGATYSFASDLTLYAQWTGVYHAVTFYENAGPSDATTATQTSNSPASLTLFSRLSPAFSYSGFTFSGWNTESNGAGTAYTDGETYSFTSDISLYAQWMADSSVSVTFDDNGGSGSIPSLSGTPGSSVTLPSGTALTYPNWTFVGWNTEANGLGVEYAPGASVNLSSSITLYAQWVEDSLVVTFDPDGGSTSASAMTYSAGSPALVLPQATLAGSAFEGWFSAPTGGVLVGAAGSSYTPTQSLTLYAQWSAAGSVTVTFDANGGSGAVESLTGAMGQPLSLPPGTSLIRPGYTFAGWGVSATGGVQYASGGSIAPTQSLTLYAIWKRSAPVTTLYGAVGDFPHFQTALTRTLSRQVMALARAVKVRGVTHVELFGYTAFTGLASLDRSVSARRAEVVARALRADLRRLHVSGVSVKASGQGSIDHRTSGVYSRVEVYLS